MADAKEATTALLPRLRPTATTAPSFRLEVETGPSRGSKLEVRVDAPGRLLIGKSEGCALQLAAADVSRRHLSLEIVGDSLRVEDLASRNGTFVDGVRIEAALLRGGETIRVGSVELTVHVGEAAVPVLPSVDRFGTMLGASTEMRRLYPLCEKLARARLPVLIEGETGTGKEVLAEAIHEQGPRSKSPFIVFDCTTVAPSLLESELFGHERGAFTGAIATKPGVFELADGGTLLIDEIGDLPLELQPKLLRALERSEIRRIGARQSQRFDVRVLSATRRDLEREVSEGRFRDDLYHRLAVGRIELPPLRRRQGDIPVLVGEFCRSNGAVASALPSSLLAAWEAYGWPGNVRELRNAVLRFLELGDDAVPTARKTELAAGTDLIDAVVAQRLPIERARRLVVEELERRAVEAALADHDGHVGRAADALGVARRHFQRLRHR